MTQGRTPKNHVDTEFMLAILEDMYRPGFTEAYMLARRALLCGALMLDEDGYPQDTEETDAGQASDTKTAEAVRAMRSLTDERTWLETVASVMGSLIGKEEDGRMPVPYGWRWASDMVRLQAEEAEKASERKAEEEEALEAERLRRIAEDGIAGRLRSLEEAGICIENEAVLAAREDFGGEYRAPSHGIVIVSDGEVRTQIRTEPLLEETALEVEEAARKTTALKGRPDEIGIFDFLSENARANLERVLEDNAAFHGYDPSATGSIGTRIFMSGYFREMVRIFLEEKNVPSDGSPEAEGDEGEDGTEKARILEFRSRNRNVEN